MDGKMQEEPWQKKQILFRVTMYIKLWKPKIIHVLKGHVMEKRSYVNKFKIAVNLIK